MKPTKVYTRAYAGIIVVVLTFMLGGCASKNIEKSYWSPGGRSLPSYSGNDSDTGIRWTVANDSTYLYFSFETHNRQVERIILFRGITLYLDPTGKRKKDTYLVYPYRSEADRQASGYRMMNNSGGSDFNFQSPSTAYWKHGDDGMLINTAMERTRFNYHIGIDSLGFMNYQVRIPIKRITDADYASINKLSVGIVVTQPEQKSGFGRNVRAHAGIGGGEESGERGGYGGRDGDDRPHGNMGEGGRFQPVNVNIWFLTELAHPSEP